MTIEERAREAVNAMFSAFDLPAKYKAIDACIEVATEQQRIARQEERERCIKAAQDTMCDVCERHFTEFCPCEKQSDEDRRTDCWKLVKIRKSIEK